MGQQRVGRRYEAAKGNHRRPHGIKRANQRSNARTYACGMPSSTSDPDGLVTKSTHKLPHSD
eukprot:6050474-Amphidinium_carterae.1